MTFLSACQMGLKNRRLLKTGYFEDIVLFDTESVADTATFVNSK